MVLIDVKNLYNWKSGLATYVIFTILEIIDELMLISNDIPMNLLYLLNVRDVVTLHYVSCPISFVLSSIVTNLLKQFLTECYTLFLSSVFRIKKRLINERNSVNIIHTDRELKITSIVKIDL